LVKIKDLDHLAILKGYLCDIFFLLLS
jgi:hypothetical protein